MSEHLGTEIRSDAPSDDEIHLLDLFIVLARYKYLILGSTVLVGALAMLASLLMTPKFVSTTTIMPPQQSQNSGLTAMLGQLGGLAGVATGAKNTNDLYIGLLESRTIADSLIARFKLQERYEQVTMEGTRRALGAASEFSLSKKAGIISIKAEDKDPRFAADLSNAYAEELARLNQSMALTEASQRRLFFEKQLKEVKDQLADAEIALRNTQETTGIIQPDSQVQAIITSVAQLKGTIAAREVQLSAMRTFAAPQNPDVLRTEQELRSLQAQLSKLEKTRPIKSGDFMVPTGQIPAAGVEYVRSLRNVKYYETIFELLSKQFELAKIDEAKDASLIQVLDKAIPSERKSRPKRALITLAGLFGGAVLGLLLTFTHALYSASRQNPDSQARWQRLSVALRLKQGKQAIARTSA